MEHIAWHPAFVEAIQLELEDFKDSLEFYPEYQLTSEPLRIDCIIIKKVKETIITKNIAAIFREINIMEYKSPDDYVSVADFYKVYGYSCLYAALEKVPINCLTISFIESHNPKELFRHFRQIRGYKVEESNPGIYTVKGDILPIQVIDSRWLSESDNLWLKSLNKQLEARTILKISNEVKQQGKAAHLQAFISVIAKANAHAIKEAINMRKETLTLDEVFEQTGMAARWEAKAKEREALTIAQNMINLGLPMEIVISATKLDPEKLKMLLSPYP